MIKKFIIILITTLALVVNSHAGSDGELILKKNDPSNVKDCFEGVNRATFAFNQGLDGILFEPVAKAYRILPSPIRTGFSNSLNNLSMDHLVHRLKRQFLQFHQYLYLSPKLQHDDPS